MEPKISILRYGHRIVRDERVTSHCCLVARAFGAQEIIIEGFEDQQLVQTVGNVAKTWGGKFKTTFTDSWKKTLKEYKKKGYHVVHCTMYGIPVKKALPSILKNKKILIIIGSQKVEKEVYLQSDSNISITTQPHSEIAALAVALHEIFRGKELEKKFEKAKIKIIPQANGKKIFELGKKAG